MSTSWLPEHDLHDLQTQLRGWCPSMCTEYVEEIDSTNEELMRRARSGVCTPVLLWARHQTAARGRLGRSWQTQPGQALTFSVSMPVAPQSWAGLSLAVGVRIAQALAPTEMRLGLKWPNDLWFEDRKLAGILIETTNTTHPQQRQVIIGVGVNITLPAHADTLSVAPACLQEISPQLNAWSALHLIAPALVAALQEFESHGFAPFISDFNARDVLHQRPIRCSDGMQGQACGIRADGSLQVLTAQGLRTVHSADISVRPDSGGTP